MTGVYDGHRNIILLFVFFFIFTLLSTTVTCHELNDRQQQQQQQNDVWNHVLNVWISGQVSLSLYGMNGQGSHFQFYKLLWQTKWCKTAAFTYPEWWPQKQLCFSFFRFCFSCYDELKLPADRWRLVKMFEALLLYVVLLLWDCLHGLSDSTLKNGKHSTTFDRLIRPVNFILLLLLLS